MHVLLVCTFITIITAKTRIKGVILFGLPRTKDPLGTSGLDPEGPVPLAVRAMKEAAPELIVMTDVCVDEYTDHGHCGVLRTRRDGQVEVDNDRTVDILAQMAAMLRSHTHAHHPAGANLKQELALYTEELKAISVIMSSTLPVPSTTTFGCCASASR